jgi:DNA-binding MarR family transcriptional regulator
MAIEPGTILETPDGVKYLEPSREAAWLAFLRTHADLTRALDVALHEHGLTLSAYEVLSRLARAGDGYMRMSELAETCGLSPSRVSRVIDELERRGLAARAPCPGDSRVVHAVITEKGRQHFARAQEAFFAVMEERFLTRLDCTEVGQLTSLLAKLGA